MKIAWVVDVWPPNRHTGGSTRGQTGGQDAARDRSSDWIESAARELAARGDEILVVAGASRAPSDPTTEALRVHVLPRSDLHREHWQRSASASVSAAFRALVRAERPDVVHVHHWRALSRDLVYVAALEGRPAVVSLHDLWTTCLIQTRILPLTRAACDAPLAARPCLACAPRTPWVPIEAQYMAFAEHKAEIVRELALARAVLVQDPAHGAAIRRFLGEDAAQLAPFHDVARADGGLAALIEIHSAAAAAGAPAVARAREGDWYTQRMKAFAEAEWERSAAAADSGEHSHTSTSSADPSS